MCRRTTPGLALIALLAAHAASADEPDSLALETDRESLAQSGWIVRLDHLDGAVEALPVTDAMLDIVTWDGPAGAALMSADAPGRSPWTWTYGVQLILVAGGRLFRNGGGMCSPFDADYAICTVECDGGHFVLHRTLTQDTARLELTLMPLPDLVEGDDSAAIRIEECADGPQAFLDRTGERPATAAFFTTLWTD
jgi:hypothetical protein